MVLSLANQHHATAKGDTRALVISGIVTGIYFVIEIILGLLSGSVAVLSDAFHTFSAVGGVLIALGAQRLSQRPASSRQTFGWARAEILGALLNGLSLAIMAVFVIWMGIMKLREPEEPATSIMLWAAAGGIVTEVIAFYLMYQRQKTNLNLKGAFWHIMQTFVGSIIIIIAALVIHFTGFLAIDPILGMAFGILLFWASWSIIRSALRILLQGTPEDLDLPDAIEALEELDGVANVHHIHAWSLTTGRHIFSAHIQTDRPDRDAQRILESASTLLADRFDIYFSTLQIEDTCPLPQRSAREIDITNDRQDGPNPTKFTDSK